jgi:hypothetical protein
MATASFTIPSPKIIENSLGYLSDLIIVKAATESVAQIVALYLTISPNDNASWIFRRSNFNYILTFVIYQQCQSKNNAKSNYCTQNTKQTYVKKIVHKVTLLKIIPTCKNHRWK